MKCIKVTIDGHLISIVKRMDELADLTDAIRAGDPGDVWRVQIIELTDREYANLGNVDEAQP